MLAEAVLAPEDTRHTEALALVNGLEVLLEQEFEALKSQDLDRFEQLLEQKNDLLEQLSNLSGANAGRLAKGWNRL